MCRRSAADAIAIAALAFYMALVAIAVLSPLNPFGGGRWFAPGCDYTMRMSEATCVVRGVNPYSVWHGDVVLQPYVPNAGAPREAVFGKPGFTDEINVYPPWEYAVMIPLALLPRTASWLTYFVLMAVGLLVMFFAGRSLCARLGGGAVACAVAGAAPVLLAGLPIYQNFHAGNLAVPVAVAVALMAACLNRGRDALAGICWAFAMLKPQIGLVFAVPILMRRKFLTCVVAVGACALASLLPAALCGVSPVTMTLQAPAASTFAYMGCGTFPYALCALMREPWSILLGLAVGALVAAFLTRCLARAGVRDWFLLLMPSAVIGAAWTYAQCYSFTMNWLYFLVLVVALVRSPHSASLWGIAALSLPVMTRLYNVVHTLPKVLPGVVPEFLPSEEWHWHVDSLLSLAGVGLAAALCVWLASHYGEWRRSER